MKSKKNFSHDSPSTSTFIPEMKSYSCFLCNKDVYANNTIGCELCSIKAHRGCLINDESMWVSKLEVCPWFCKSCREFYCSQCLKIVTDKLEFLSCVTCKVGMHYDCFNSLADKPLKKVENSDLYVCIPCEIATTQILEEQKNKNEIECKEIIEEENNDLVQNESEEEKDHISSSDKVDTEEHDDNSINSSLLDYSKDSSEVENEDIPDVTMWSKYKVYDYLSNRLPKTVLPKIIKHEIDGRALLLLQRKDITLYMGLKLGDAMKLYKEVRILQSQSTYVNLYWE